MRPRPQLPSFIDNAGNRTAIDKMLPLEWHSQDISLSFSVAGFTEATARRLSHLRRPTHSASAALLRLAYHGGFLAIDARQRNPVVGLKVCPKLRGAAQHFAEDDCDVRMMAFSLWIIWSMTCSGQLVEAANSCWVIPRTSSSSARVSPGGIARSEYTRGGLVVIMVAYFLNYTQYSGALRPV